MIDNFSLGVSHGLMMLAAFLLMRRIDLDREPSARAQAKNDTVGKDDAAGA